MRCELNSFSVLIALCRKVFSSQFFSTVNPKLYRSVSADSILETIKQIMFTFLQVGLMKDDLNAYEILQYVSMSAVFVLEIPTLLCDFGILVVCKPCFSSVTNTLCIPSTSTDLNPQKNKWFWKP